MQLWTARILFLFKEEGNKKPLRNVEGFKKSEIGDHGSIKDRKELDQLWLTYLQVKKL